MNLDMNLDMFWQVASPLLPLDDYYSHADRADFRRAHLLSLVLASGTLTLGIADKRGQNDPPSAQVREFSAIS